MAAKIHFFRVIRRPLQTIYPLLQTEKLPDAAVLNNG
jgi:hypothetical protein